MRFNIFSFLSSLAAFPNMFLVLNFMFMSYSGYCNLKNYINLHNLAGKLKWVSKQRCPPMAELVLYKIMEVPMWMEPSQNQS